MKLKICNIIVIIMLACSFTLSFSSQGYSGSNEQLMSVKMAKSQALKALAESLAGIKLRAFESFVFEDQAMVDALYKASAKVQAKLRDYHWGEIIWDPEKRVAYAEVWIEGGSVWPITEITPVELPEEERIRAYGFGTLNPEAKQYLLALGAARINAYDELARKLIGLKIKGKTTTKNFINQSDQTRIKTAAILYGAQIVDFGWDQDKNAFVTLEIKPNSVRDIFGQTIEFAEDETVRATGYGATEDVVTPDLPRMSGSGPGVVEKSLNIPFGSSVAEDLKAKDQQRHAQ